MPAALCKALGGLRANGVKHARSWRATCSSGEFTATQFLSDVDGHPEQTGALQRALEELSFFSREVEDSGRVSGRAVPFDARRGRDGLIGRVE